MGKDITVSISVIASPGGAKQSHRRAIASSLRSSPACHLAQPGQAQGNSPAM